MTENFYFDDPDEGVERYPTLEAAKNAAESALDHWREKASGESWHENIEHLEYGIMVPVGSVRQTNVQATPESERHDFTCDYELIETAAPSPDRTLRYIRNAVQSYKVGGDAAAAVFAIGLIERILDEGHVPEQSALETIGAAAVAHRVATSGYYNDVNGVTAKDYVATVERLESLITDYVAGQSEEVKPEPDPRLAMCDDISLIAQDWAEQYDTARDNHAEDFMKRVCDVIGTTYGGGAK